MKNRRGDLMVWGLIPFLFVFGLVGEEPLRPLAVPSTAQVITVDGRLDEGAWDHAAILPLPYEWTPGDNIPSLVETECRILYSRSHLYIGFICSDPQPKAIRAHLMDRDDTDSLIRDDHISIMLDPFNDERRGFQFRVNPLGVQADAIFSELEGYEDFSWDAIWQSAGTITREGYQVELAIPFNQLRFRSSKTDQVWGFSAERSHPREVRRRFTSHKRSRSVNCILCQFNKLSGFADISPGRNIEVIPTLTSTRSDQINPDSRDMENGDVKVEPGITAKWGISPNLILNATINPDFSQVEADVAELNVNNRYALRYPEKRPFFMEGADFFLTPIEAVFTRTVYDPIWGAKLTAKSGSHAFGLFATQDQVTNLLIPSNSGSMPYAGEQNVLGSVLRYRRDIGRGSTLGALFSGRLGEEAYENLVVGLDGFLRISPTKSAQIQFIASQTRYDEGMAEAYSQDPDRFYGSALHARFNHFGREWSYILEYNQLSPGFRADSGFVPRVDYREASFLLQKTFWGDQSAWYNRISLSLFADHTVDFSGNVTDQFLSLSALYLGPLQTTIQPQLRFVREKYLELDYNLLTASLYFEQKPINGLRYALSFRVGEAIDYSNLRLSDSWMLRPEMELSLGRHLAAGINHAVEQLHHEGRRVYTVHLSQLRLVYNFSTRAFLRAILQYTDLSRDPDLYLSPTGRTYRRLFGQFLFSYKINPRTVFFLGYSDNRNDTLQTRLGLFDRTLFMKIGYALTL